MKTWNIPSAPKALVFDLDSTLYTHADYARFQTDILVERLAKVRGVSVEALESLLARLRAETKSATGADTSLGNLFLSLGVPIETSIRWREELIDPLKWLSPDPRLFATLSVLAQSFHLCLVTNNPRSVGQASLQALGCAALFEFIVGLDDSGRSKPDPASFALARARLGLEGNQMISIGDRADVDIFPALSLGMGGILIDSVEEVYSLSVLFVGRK